MLRQPLVARRVRHTFELLAGGVVQLVLVVPTALRPAAVDPQLPGARGQPQGGRTAVVGWLAPAAELHVDGVGAEEELGECATRVAQVLQRSQKARQWPAWRGRAQG